MQIYLEAVDKVSLFSQRAQINFLKQGTQANARFELGRAKHFLGFHALYCWFISVKERQQVVASLESTDLMLSRAVAQSIASGYILISG